MITGMDTKKSMPPADWHAADVKAALEKRGVTLSSLAKKYGYSHIQRVLVSHWWAAEQIVATALGVRAEVIWPTRYVTPRDRGQGMTRNVKALKLGKSNARSARAAQAAPATESTALA